MPATLSFERTGQNKEFKTHKGMRRVRAESREQGSGSRVGDEIVNGVVDICIQKEGDELCILLVATVYYHSTLFIIQFS